MNKTFITLIANMHNHEPNEGALKVASRLHLPSSFRGSASESSVARSLEGCRVSMAGTLTFNVRL